MCGDSPSGFICCDCIGDSYLSNEVASVGQEAACSYCGRTQKCYPIGDLADRIDEVFQEHFFRTADSPSGWQLSLLSDKESGYDWDREGEPAQEAIRNSADIPDAAAADVLEILAERYSDLDSAALGEETEFARESYYQESSVTDEDLFDEWLTFEFSLKHEARLFSEKAEARLESIFQHLDKLQTRDGRSLIVEAGPDSEVRSLYRARVFQSGDRLEEALSRPDRHLGSPPPISALAGRMNARGISVFYGATASNVAIAEVRPPVGARVGVAEFTLLRSIRLLDLTALGEVREQGSLYDPTFGPRLKKALFLKRLSQRMTRPVMPDDEGLEYLPTQAVADFLATRKGLPLDGIMYPSVQVPADARNVVLFHKASLVEPYELPDGTKLRVSQGMNYEGGFEIEYDVSEQLPEPVPELDVPVRRRPPGPPRRHQTSYPTREPTLRVNLESVTVHHVTGVHFVTEPHRVRRTRWKQSDLDKLPF